MLFARHLSPRTRQIAKQWLRTFRQQSESASCLRLNLPRMNLLQWQIRTLSDLIGTRVSGSHLDWKSTSTTETLLLGHNIPMSNPDIDCINQARYAHQFTYSKLLTTNVSSPVDPQFRVVTFKKGTFKFYEHLQLQRRLAQHSYFRPCIGHNPSLGCLIFEEPREMPPERMSLFLSHPWAMSSVSESWLWAARVMKDILHAISILHSQDVIHTGKIPYNAVSLPADVPWIFALSMFVSKPHLISTINRMLMPRSLSGRPRRSSLEVWRIFACFLVEVTSRAGHTTSALFKVRKLSLEVP